MTKSTKIFTAIIVALGLVIIWLVFRDRFPQTPEVVQEVPKEIEEKPIPREEYLYKNDKYGFRFSYQEGYKILEASPELISLGRETIRGIDPIVQIVLVRSGTDTGIMSFEEFVIDAAREYCISRKAETISECTRIDDVVNIAPFKTDSGVAGQVFYLKYEETDIESQNTTRGRRGPFFTFNTSSKTPNEMSFIMIYNPISIPAEKANEDVIRFVAKSFSISQ